MRIHEYPQHDCPRRPVRVIRLAIYPRLPAMPESFAWIVLTGALHPVPSRPLLLVLSGEQPRSLIVTNSASVSREAVPSQA